MKEVKIEMVHDIVCSWCPIGYRNIQTAISNLDIKVDFQFIPYELNPDMPAKGEAIESYFRRRGWSGDKLREYQKSLVETAADAGVTIDFSKRTHYYNTKSAHKLMRWAAGFNEQTALNEILIKAYFEDGQNISDVNVLLELAEQVGLERISTKNAISSPELTRELNDKMARGQAFNIQSIPAFILNEDTLISGSHSVEFFEKTLPTHLRGS